MAYGGGAVAFMMRAAVPVRGPAAAQGAPLRVGLGSSIPAVLDPATALEGSVPFIARQVFDTLLQYRDGSSDIEAGVAAYLDVSRPRRPPRLLLPSRARTPRRAP